MKTDLMVNKKQIAYDFAEVMKGKMEQDKIDAGVAKILGWKSSFPASAGYYSALFYYHVGVTFIPPTGHAFTGNGSGIGIPFPISFTGGAVFTDDLPGLLANTVSFQFDGAPGFFNVNFFDNNSNLLGSFVGAGINFLLGVGGGAGSWS
jgi:hypothetical protein